MPDVSSRDLLMRSEGWRAYLDHTQNKIHLGDGFSALFLWAVRWACIPSFAIVSITKELQSVIREYTHREAGTEDSRASLYRNPTSATATSNWNQIKSKAWHRSLTCITVDENHDCDPLIPICEQKVASFPWDGRLNDYTAKSCKI